MYSAGIKAKKLTAVVLAVILVFILGTAFVSSVIAAYGETVDYYEVKVGNSTFATVATKEEAESIIEGTKQRFIDEGAEALSVAVDPVMTINPRTYRVKTDTLPELAEDTEEVIDELVAGRTVVSEYTVQEGDTAEQLTGMLGCTEDEIAEQNEAALEEIEPGTQLRYEKNVPYFKVKVEQFVEVEEEIPFTAVYEDTGNLFAGEEQVKTQGVNGLKKVTYRQCVVNGEVQHSEVYSEEVITPAVNQVILRGTKLRSDAERQRVINYALQFCGNPYSYGGTSLTNGCDCSGFIYRVFQDCGYTDVPRVGIEYVYPNVSADELIPGDVVVYATHYGLYIGNGEIVSAVNYAEGIRVTPIWYCGTGWWYGVRVIQ